MKRLLAPIAALLALAATPLAAQPLAAGEIELKIEALGEIPADTAIVPVQVVGRGTTDAAAKADLAKKEKEVRAGLAKLGIPAAKIEAVKDDEPQYAIVRAAPVAAECAVEEAAVYDSPAAAGAAAAAAAAVSRCDDPTFSRTLMVTVEDLSKLPAIANLVEEDYYVQSSGKFFHRDPKAAHAAAIAEAIANARKDAEIYAAAMGMRVVRMLRVTNKKADLNWPDVFGLFGGFTSQLDIQDSEETALYQVRAYAAADFAGVTIDFVLATK